jgi:hypothetical protein
MTLHLTAADDPPRPDPLTPLARFFALAWRDFLRYQEWSGPDLQEAIAASGLGEWIRATQAGPHHEVGDSIVTLTDAGRAALEAHNVSQRDDAAIEAAKR